MTKYYLLENREIFFPTNTYTIEVTDKKFLKTIKGLKKDKISVFITNKRKPIDSYDDEFSEDDMFDTEGFNIFFGTFGQLTIDKSNNKYEYTCYGVAEVRSGVYNDNQVEYLDINVKETIDNGFDKKSVLKELENKFKTYLNKEGFDIDYFKTDDLEKFINKNIKYFPMDRTLRKRVLYILDLEKKAAFVDKSISYYLLGHEFKREIDNKVKTNIDTQQKEYFLREQMKVVQDELKQIKPYVELANEVLTSKTGAGNDFLGWIDLPETYDKDEFARIKKAAEKIKNDSEVLVVIGIGGSYLGAKAAIEFLSHSFYNNLPKDKRKTPEIYFAGTNMSGVYLQHLIDVVGDRDFSVNVISKSGTTTEPAIAFRVFKKMLEEKYGKEEAAKRIYATTDKAKGALKTLATAEGYETFVVPDNVGGRFSVLTAVGLLPIAAAGIDIDD